MKDQELLERVTLNSRVMVGKQVIRGARLSVECILNLLVHGDILFAALSIIAGLISLSLPRR